MILGVPAATSVRFSQVARLLALHARSLGLVAPGYRCPPRLAGVDRSIRWWPEGPVVAVRMRGRPFDQAVADMIEGVVAANRLAGGQAQRCRRLLWSAVAEEGVECAA